MAVHSAIRNPDSLHFSSQSSLEVGIFLHGCKIIAPPSGIASVIKRPKRRWRAGGKSSLLYAPPLLLVQGHPLWDLLPTPHCPGALLTQESLGKTLYFYCTCGCHKQKQGSYVKRRRTDMGRRGRTRCVWHNNLWGLGQQALLSEAGWGVSPWKAPFTLLFPMILTQRFEEVGPLSFPGALKDIFLVRFFSLRNEGQEEGKGPPLPWTNLSRAHISPATNRDGRPGQPFDLGTGMEDGWRINYAIS